MRKVYVHLHPDKACCGTVNSSSKAGTHYTIDHLIIIKIWPGHQVFKIFHLH